VALPLEQVATTPEVAFRDALLRAGVLFPSSASGVYGRSRTFESAFDAVDRYVGAAGAADAPEVFRFPPIVALDTLVRTAYLRSFPDLIGSIHAFDGTEAEHESLLRNVVGGAAGWAAPLQPTELVLVPAACYPLYPLLTGELPAAGRMFDVMGSCFRNEPSDDPARMRAFHQHEYVYVGTAERARAFRDTWLARAPEMMTDLGLDVVAEIANDPFFGRTGSMLAASQRANALKFEILAPVANADRLTAIASCNCHLDNLTVPFEITAAGGEAAHSACAGFGIERVTLALFAAHGFDPDRWPGRVRERLWS
jgi:seryl-tRNA synthetase